MCNSFIAFLVSTWVSEEVVDRWHNFWGLVAYKLPQEMFRILLSLSKVIQHSSSPILLAHSDSQMIKRNDVLISLQNSYLRKQNIPHFNGGNLSLLTRAYRDTSPHRLR